MMQRSSSELFCAWSVPGIGSDDAVQLGAVGDEDAPALQVRFTLGEPLLSLVAEGGNPSIGGIGDQPGAKVPSVLALRLAQPELGPVIVHVVFGSGHGLLVFTLRGSLLDCDDLFGGVEIFLHVIRPLERCESGARPEPCQVRLAVRRLGLHVALRGRSRGDRRAAFDR